jgi:release factor glutamine methyltransferase
VTVRELITAGEALLESAGVTDKAIDARLLYCHLAQVDRTRMILQYRDQVTEEFQAAYQGLLNRRAAGEPLQYITGVQDFMGFPFLVAPGVLIPRPETELLVEKAVAWACGDDGTAEAGVGGEGSRRTEPVLAACDDRSQASDPSAAIGIRILDIGCGSGAIGVSLAKLVPDARVTCIDISRRALEITGENAARLGAKVELLQGDLLEPVAGRQFDLIVSNPPYIADEVIAGLAREVRDHEPGKALSGGKDGLNIYRRMIPELPTHIVPGGMVMMEIGYDQMEAVKRLLAETGAFTRIAGYQDLAGKDRIVTGERIADGSIV